jgi:hypothetical protein
MVYLQWFTCRYLKCQKIDRAVRNRTQRVDRPWIPWPRLRTDIPSHWRWLRKRQMAHISGNDAMSPADPQDLTWLNQIAMVFLWNWFKLVHIGSHWFSFTGCHRMSRHGDVSRQSQRPQWRTPRPGRRKPRRKRQGRRPYRLPPWRLDIAGIRSHALRCPSSRPLRVPVSSCWSRRLVKSFKIHFIHYI